MALNQEAKRFWYWYGIHLSGYLLCKYIFFLEKHYKALNFIGEASIC